MRKRRPSKKRVTTRSDDAPGMGSRPNTANPAPPSAGAELEQLAQRGELPDFIKRLILFASHVSGLSDTEEITALLERAILGMGPHEERLRSGDSLFRTLATLLGEHFTHGEKDGEGGDE